MPRPFAFLAKGWDSNQPNCELAKGELSHSKGSPQTVKIRPVFTSLNLNSLDANLTADNYHTKAHNLYMGCLHSNNRLSAKGISRNPHGPHPLPATPPYPPPLWRGALVRKWMSCYGITISSPISFVGGRRHNPWVLRPGLRGSYPDYSARNASVGSTAAARLEGR